MITKAQKVIERYLCPPLWPELAGEEAVTPSDIDLKNYAINHWDRIKYFLAGKYAYEYGERIKKILNEAISRLTEISYQENTKKLRRLQNPWLRRQEVTRVIGTVHPEVQPRGPAPKTSK